LYEQAQLQRRNSQASQKTAQQAQESQDVKMEASEDASAGAEQNPGEVAMSIEEPESDEAAAIKNSEAAAALFGQDHLKPVEDGMEYFSSPLIQSRNELHIDSSASKGVKHEEAMEAMALDVHPRDDVVTMADWDSLLSPENVDPAELEDMFDAY
jgi:hypothetical protein